jgi:hypothetical protein
MFDDIIKKEPSGMICCATCLYSQRKREENECPRDSEQCFHHGKTMIYKDFNRFNPVYRYSKWEFVGEDVLTEKDLLQK